MSEVKRFYLDSTDGRRPEMVEDPDGFYCEFNVYRAAQSELAALREELAETQQISQQEELRANEYATQLVAAEQRNAELKHELELSERGRIAMWGRSEEMATARDCVATNYNQLSYGATACKEKLVFAEQHIAELTNLIEKAHTWVDRNNCGGWDAYELRDQLAAALKPTESGESE